MAGNQLHFTVQTKLDVHAIFDEHLNLIYYFFLQ